MSSPDFPVLYDPGSRFLTEWDGIARKTVGNVPIGAFLPPIVMTTPPTVVAGGAAAASSIASARVISATSGGAISLLAPWRYSGAPVGTTGFSVAGASVQGGFHTGAMYSVEFEIDCTTFEFQIFGGSSAAYRVLVDGQYVSLTPTNVLGNFYNMLVTFGSRAIRRIQLDLSGGAEFTQLNVGPNDTVWAPTEPPGPKVVVMGDSYTAGTGATFANTAYVTAMANALGWKDVNASGMGTTGYITPGTGVTFRTRVITDVISRAPDVVVIAGGINDVIAAASATAVGAEAALLFAQIRAALPNVKLVVVGNWTRTGTPTALEISTRDALKTACNADTGAHLFVDNIVATTAGVSTLGWITGTGKVGSTTGTGNADLYMSADGVHPSQAGHDYLGRRLAAAIAAGFGF